MSHSELKHLLILLPGVLKGFYSISATADHQNILLHKDIKCLSLSYWSVADKGKHFRLETYYLYARDPRKYLSHKLISVFAENQKVNPR